jgi:PAS domain S-box-containing protein
MFILGELFSSHYEFNHIILDASLLIILSAPFLLWFVIKEKQGENELLQEKDRLEDVTGYANCGMLLLDNQTRITYANNIAEKWFGPFHRIGGKFCWEVYKINESEKECASLEALRTGETAHRDISMHLENGDQKFFYIIASPVKDNSGKIRQINEIVIDVTERKKAEETRLENLRLEAADKTKSEFLANMSHELRTPLNASIGFSELLKMGLVGKLTEKQEEYVDHILTSNQFLLTLINDILDLSKIEAGKIELVLDKMSVPVIIKETLSLIKEKAMMHNVLLETEFDLELGFIEADKQRFKQVLFNLLSNAVKFSKKEGGTVTITAKKEGDMVKISVSDTGIGIKEENVGKLFHKFEQLESGISQKYGGTGLGLAITKQLVELHGGRIWAESIYGEGSTFMFTLPLEVKKEENK